MKKVGSKFIFSFIYMLSVFSVSSAQSFFTIIDDDAQSREAVSSVNKVADRRGVKISYAVVAQKLQQDKMMVELLLEYQRQGHHICNHSLTHSSIWKTPHEDDIKFELEQSERILDSLGFKNHNFLVYPFGKFSKSTYTWLIPLVSQKFKMAFESRGYGNDLKKTNRYTINRLPLRKHDSRLIVRSLINETIDHHGWIVFYTHSGNSRDYSDEMLEETIAYCQERGMKCLTVKEAEELGLLDNVCVKEWTSIDEFIYVLYMHIEWVVLILLIIGAVISCWIWLKIKCYG